MRKVLRIPVLALFLVLSLSLEGQLNNTIYFMQGIPQSNRVNPAFQPRENVYVGIPALSPLRAQFSTGGLAWEDVIYGHPESPDSLITFLHPLGSKERFINNLKPVNMALGGIGTSILSFGFRTRAGYFSLDMSVRGEGNIHYPRDFFELVLEGTDVGKQYRLDGLGTDLAVYDELGIGWSYELLDNMHVGARAKMLFGIANLDTYKSTLGLDIAENRDWILTSDMQFRASLPFAEVVYDENMMIEDIALKEEFESYKLMDLASYFFNFKNFGLGLDLGIDYWPLEELQISASLVDLGYIRWNDEVHHARYSTAEASEEGSYRFEGLELNPFELSDDYSFDDFVDSSLSVLGDSLLSFLEFREGGAYSRMLNAKFYAGVSYYLTPKINLGLLSRTDFLGGKIREQLTATANFTTGRFLNFSLSYSYMDSYFKNLGAGLSAHMGPFNFYLVSDNVLNAVFWPQEARSVNLLFGINLMFGYRQKTDLPLVE